MEKEQPKQRRLRERLALSLPVQVRGVADATTWAEMSRLLDVTPFGAGLRLSRPVEPGRLVHLTLMMPRALRCFDYAEDQYRVWVLVRSLRQLPPPAPGDTSGPAPQPFALGTAFVGKHPPASYLRDPTTRYDARAADGGLWNVFELANAATAGGQGAAGDARLETRLSVPVEVIVEVLGACGELAASEQTVTENISRKGAAVFTSLELERGSFVRLRSARHPLAVLAVVRGRRTGPGGVKRLHLEFLDRQWPLQFDN